LFWGDVSGARAAIIRPIERGCFNEIATFNSDADGGAHRQCPQRSIARHHFSQRLIKLGGIFCFARDDFAFLWSETTLNDNDCISR